ncbi:FtsQ-type POTRA domain-containing protein [Thermodesulfobacterium sp. TA1]|uniref:cell division protein FtsQ/DivIB n=1 Tax=Thermodesulfobacterium sp. TA1 TaxID=2234087 RepID=UPI001231CDDC|nr:FtsQ-type POTRA domain-containing protein [Thermodesulfobacterium sp. TA1]QER41668.1 FtsQ-type POTRA domain-containing protein [Thermodesulfobacterium sp. TA1]
MGRFFSLLKRPFFWGTIGILGLLALVFYVLYFTDLFVLKEVKVSPTKRVSKEEIIKLAELKGGERFFTISLKDLRARILSNENIEEVTIVRRLPGTLEFIIKEREPLAILIKNNKGYLVDKKGVIMEGILPEDYFFYPVLEIKNEMLKDKLFEFLYWLKNNKNYLPVYENISKIELEDSKMIILTKNKIKIYLPLIAEKDWVYFYKNLDKIMAYLYEKGQTEKIELIRLDYPVGQALIKFRE